ncbi:uncharacterized protein K460DRAFT_269703 [Cucurbitaria berberidis CBS 394.84]|uniref:Uncharacterized protein n=1 Tax=Cucurbitaria berberidis CBS 394.84 TaxID=1168544 RepID=A0A9P4GVG2_9PLEO|nr:uncharacterized protein K460DRAFT_269703 [Cucurbitaria berberidis CBS 394.84]KAF1852042.1 hypothetical protein K460DRAFT_269703 [Cucurbitaria berberidis CBS 394.84]
MRSGPPQSRRSAAPALPHRTRARQQTWPPSPSVEDETAIVDEGEPPNNTRGTVDQEYLLDEIEQPPVAHDAYNDRDDYDRRFVLVSDPSTEDEARSTRGAHRDRRRKSFAERGNMAHIKTSVDEPPVFTERVSTPYAYTKPQKESTAPSPGAFLRSPEPITPTKSTTRTYAPSHDTWDTQREQNARPSNPRPTRSRQNSFSKSRPPSRYGRHETMPVPTPRIDVRSPSPARPPPGGTFLPYPVDDNPAHVFMPPEEYYQFDHSTIVSPRELYPESPRVSSSSIPGSPRVTEAASRSSKKVAAMPESPVRTRIARSNSARSQMSQDTRREQSAKKIAALDLDRPLSSCPRSELSARYDDWFNLQGYPNFNVCPTCYDGVFADTPFAIHFSETRPYVRSIERACDFSSPWMRLAWLLTIKQRRQSLDLLYALADIAGKDRPCPGDREFGTDRLAWYGIPNQRDGVHVANFAVCSCDKKMIEVLFPSMRGYFTMLPTNYQSSVPDKFLCSLRTSSRRFPRYLDLLVELDAEAQSLGQRPNINRFIQLARDNAFKGECAKDKSSTRKPWHFIPSLPEFTVCEECYDELVWPASQSKSVPSTLPRLFNKAIQLVPGEESDVGSSCCLYSPRMRRIWDTSVKEEDFAYLKRKAIERKKMETRLARERKGIVSWLLSAERGSSQWESARSELRGLEKEWATWE